MDYNIEQINSSYPSGGRNNQFRGGRSKNYGNYQQGTNQKNFNQQRDNSYQQNNRSNDRNYGNYNQNNRGSRFNQYGNGSNWQHNQQNNNGYVREQSPLNYGGNSRFGNESNQQTFNRRDQQNYKNNGYQQNNFPKNINDSYQFQVGNYQGLSQNYRPEFQDNYANQNYGGFQGYQQNRQGDNFQRQNNYGNNRQPFNRNPQNSHQTSNEMIYDQRPIDNYNTDSRGGFQSRNQYQNNNRGGFQNNNNNRQFSGNNRGNFNNNSHYNNRNNGREYQGGYQNGSPNYNNNQTRRNDRNFRNEYEPQRKEMSQQDLQTILGQKQNVQIQNHKILKLPPEILISNHNQPYILQNRENQKGQNVDLSQIRSIQGMQKVVIPNSHGQINNFYNFPELQRAEIVDSVKGFKQNIGLNYQEFQRMGDELSRQILSNILTLVK